MPACGTATQPVTVPAADAGTDTAPTTTPVDTSGVIEEINLAGETLLGRPRDALIGSSLFSFLPSGEALAVHLKRLADGGTVNDQWLARQLTATAPAE